MVSIKAILMTDTHNLDIILVTFTHPRTTIHQLSFITHGTGHTVVEVTGIRVGIITASEVTFRAVDITTKIVTIRLQNGVMQCMTPIFYHDN